MTDNQDTRDTSTMEENPDARSPMKATSKPKSGTKDVTSKGEPAMQKTTSVKKTAGTARASRSPSTTRRKPSDASVAVKEGASANAVAKTPTGKSAAVKKEPAAAAVRKAPVRAPRKAPRKPAESKVDGTVSPATDTHSAQKDIMDKPSDVINHLATVDSVEKAQNTASAEAVVETASLSGEKYAAESIASSHQEIEAPSDQAAIDDAGVSASISTDPTDIAEADDEPEPAVVESPQLGQVSEDDTSEEEDVDFDEIREQLMALQQEIRLAKIPVVIVFEGWDASGKGTLMSKLIEGLDPRGYQVYPVRRQAEEDRRYPAMRRYWSDMPAQGNISIFCSSWYREVSNACFESKTARKRLNQSYQEIINLESQMVADGVRIIKFFLHIPRKEQKRRLKELESKKSTRWRVEKEDWTQNERYEEALRLYDAMIARTHFDGSQWHVLRSDNKRACLRQIYQTVLDEFNAALKDRKTGLRTWDTPFLPHLENVMTLSFPQLDAFDPDQALTDPYKPAVDKAQKQLHKLQDELYRRKIPMAVCFEGWDASGKGGVIRRLTSSLDARGFDVVPVSSPTPLEKSHHHLWRFWQALPADGHIAIFDRTWYGRVLVERVEGFCTESQWKRAYEELNRFEAELTGHGMVLCKFWLQIDSATQLTRFQERQADPEKQWKITDEDWRNREKWPEYEMAVNEMLQKTNTSSAPWTVVEANNKQYARLKVLQTVIQAIEQRLETEKS